MRSFRRIAAVAATATLAVTIAACGGGGNGAGAPPVAGEASSINAQPRDNIKDGGTFTEALIEISTQFNQFQGDATLYSRIVARMYTPELISFTEDGGVQYNRDYLASDPKEETVDGNTRITYTINPKATWNDGSPIDWTAFEATWKTNNGKDKAYSVLSSDGYDRIASVTRGADDKQAVVTFNGLWVWWPGLFNWVLNPKAADPKTFNEGFLNEPHNEWGAGPYQIQKWDKQNSTLVFERNPKWWGEPGKLDTHTILGMDTPAAVNAFKNGQLDAVYTPNAEQVNQLKDVAGAEKRTATRASLYLLQFNAKTPALADPAVRKALMEGVDRGQIAKIVFQGLDYTEKVPGSLALLPGQEGYQDNFPKVVTFDTRKAKADLDAAGYPAGPDGMRAKDGKPLQFDFVYTGETATKKAVGAAVVKMMKDIGVTANVRALPASEFSSVIANRSFDVFFNGFAQSDPYGVAYFCQLYCTDSQLNLSQSGNADLDAKIKAVGTLPTQKEQIAKANEVEVEAFGTYGLMPIYSGADIAFVKKGLANYGPDWGGGATYYNPRPENVGWQK
ncbi:ABC transporter family substrate-binding protein [Pseudonocardia sp. CA-107938]|uniref:ABC transporter family substrate-binding protein n=1 Tax=Pseudonocardia sp. CA-107938 TaxID=3240021 RepID=UPI003D942169